ITGEREYEKDRNDRLSCRVCVPADRMRSSGGEHRREQQCEFKRQCKYGLKADRGGSHKRSNNGPRKERLGSVEEQGSKGVSGPAERPLYRIRQGRAAGQGCFDHVNYRCEVRGQELFVV